MLEGTLEALTFDNTLYKVAVPVLGREVEKRKKGYLNQSGTP